MHSLDVVIVNWKSVSYLLPCLKSLIDDNGLDGRRITVVDNNSQDGCGVTLAHQFPTVRFIQAQENLGFGSANNLGARGTQGDWLLFLNPDTEVPAGALQKLMRMATEHQSTGICGVRLTNTDGSRQLSSILVPPSAFSPLLSLARIIQWRHRKAWAATTPVPVAAVSGACLLIRRWAFVVVGGWDERFHMYTEDTDLCTSVIKTGWNVLHVPVKVLHHGGKSSDQKSVSWKGRQMCESRDLYLHKHRSAFVAGTARVCVLVIGLLRSVSRLRKPQALSQSVGTVRWALGLK